ncbi:MAG TPA: rRNA adenine dimethyltransferase family protein [Verrucomicrobiae bacterium]|nr:rRNA adenine dimethyltransferase family protein [Verrucomicrobiae bacterium]
MKLSDMREILTKRDIQLTKSLGQNFLHDENQLRKIVEAAELSPTDKVLEIGPGLGPLTELLLENASEVLAIEKDLRLVEVLREKFKLLTPPLSSFGEEREKNQNTPNNLPSPRPSGEKVADRPDEGKLNLLHADALEFLETEKRDWRDWKLVANLPYSVASPILVELACGARAPKKIVVTLQLEVAQRLMAQTDDDDYGILTLLVQLDFAPHSFFKIPPGSFFPSPDVDSVCVILNRRDQPLLLENLRASFTKIVKRAFSQRRKMMLKLLKADWPQEKLTRAFAELKISPQERAEKLSLEQFVELTKSLST